MESEKMFSRGPHDYFCIEDNMSYLSEISWFDCHSDSPKPKCSVQDSEGGHCPEEPVIFFEIDEEMIGLCKKCYENYQQSVYDRDKIRAQNEEILFRDINSMEDTFYRYKVPF